MRCAALDWKKGIEEKIGIPTIEDASGQLCRRSRHSPNQRGSDKAVRDSSSAPTIFRRVPLLGPRVPEPGRSFATFVLLSGVLPGKAPSDNRGTGAACTLFCERRIYPTDSKPKPRSPAGRNRRRTRILEKTGKLENGQEKTGLTAILSEPANRGTAKQARSPRNRNGHFLDGIGSSMRRARMGATDDSAEMKSETQLKTTLAVAAIHVSLRLPPPPARS